MAQIANGAYTPPKVPTGTQTASSSFIRRPVVAPPPVPTRTFVAPSPLPPTAINLATPRLEEPTTVAPTGINVAQLLAPPAERQYDFTSRFGAPPLPDIEQRRYTLPQFGEQPSGFGIDGTLNRQQLVEAARLTGEAMFVYGEMPDVISIDVARELPYNPKSGLFQDLMQESFGVPGFDTADEWLTQLGYYEYEPGKWEILDPVTVTGYGAGVYQGGGTTRRGGGSAARGSGYGYSQGGSLVNWRIGF